MAQTRFPTGCWREKGKPSTKSWKYMEMRSDKSHSATGFSHIFQDCLQLGLAFQWLKHQMLVWGWVKGRGMSREWNKFKEIKAIKGNHRLFIFFPTKNSAYRMCFFRKMIPWRCHPSPQLPLLSFETAAQCLPKIPGRFQRGEHVHLQLTYCWWKTSG